MEFTLLWSILSENKNRGNSSLYLANYRLKPLDAMKNIILEGYVLARLTTL